MLLECGHYHSSLCTIVLISSSYQHSCYCHVMCKLQASCHLALSIASKIVEGFKVVPNLCWFCTIIMVLALRLEEDRENRPHVVVVQNA